MRLLTVLSLLVLAATASAQKVSGRHFHRDTRLPKTPAATNVVEAGHTTRTVKPLNKLRSGRAWPKHHFRRLPAAKAIAPAKSTVKPVDAAAKKAAKRSGFWGPRK